MLTRTCENSLFCSTTWVKTLNNQWKLELCVYIATSFGLHTSFILAMQATVQLFECKVFYVGGMVFWCVTLVCAESCIQLSGWWCCTMWWQHLWPWSTWVLMQTSVWVSREMGESGFLSTRTHPAHGSGVESTQHTDMAEDSCLHIKTWKCICVCKCWLGGGGGGGGHMQLKSGWWQGQKGRGVGGSYTLQVWKSSYTLQVWKSTNHHV